MAACYKSFICYTFNLENRGINMTYNTLTNYMFNCNRLKLSKTKHLALFFIILKIPQVCKRVSLA